MEYVITHHGKQRFKQERGSLQKKHRVPNSRQSNVKLTTGEARPFKEEPHALKKRVWPCALFMDSKGGDNRELQALEGKRKSDI
jgi:hypothetical protein